MFGFIKKYLFIINAFTKKSFGKSLASNSKGRIKCVSLKNRQCCCEGKELDDWSSCKDDYMWNANTCDCQRHNARKIDEY